MLKKIVKWTLIVVGALIVILAVIFYSLVSSTNKKMHTTWNIEPASIMIPTDSASLERGMKRAHVLCLDCHGEGFAGRVFVDDPAIGRIDAHNLTPGKGGIGHKYSDVDWIRAIRHGVNKEGRPLFIMPSNDFHHMSERDLSEVIAYMKTIPAVDKEWLEEPQMKPFAKALAALGAFGDFLPVEKIDHQAAYEMAPPEEPNSEYGDYLVNVFGCKHCHGAQLNGGPGAAPHSPFSPNLTPGGRLGKWSNAEFHKAMRTGWTPEGKQLSESYMPWKATQNMSDLELTAVYEYLQSLPKLSEAKE